MYVCLPEGTHRSKEAVIKYADHMRVSILKSAIGYIKYYNGIRCRTSLKMNMPVQRANAYRTLIYTDISARDTRVWCEPIKSEPNNVKMTMQYVSARLR